jgi:hypothetical protein
MELAEPAPFAVHVRQQRAVWFLSPRAAALAAAVAFRWAQLGVRRVRTWHSAPLQSFHVAALRVRRGGRGRASSAIARCCPSPPSSGQPGSDEGSVWSWRSQRRQSSRRGSSLFELQSHAEPRMEERPHRQERVMQCVSYMSSFVASLF